MKRLLSVLLLLTLLFTSLCSTTAYAVGDGNVDNGGGGMGQGTSTDKWSPGNEGPVFRSCGLWSCLMITPEPFR